MHPAIPLILEAEGTPAFHHQSAAVEEILAQASQTEPETLEAVWVARLAIRLCDLMLLRRELDRAALWLKVADEKCAELTDPQFSLRLGVLKVRDAIRRGAHEDAGDKLHHLHLALEATREGLGEHEQGLRAKIDLVGAELARAVGDHGRIIALLAPHWPREKAFDSLDDMWRVGSMLALAFHTRLQLDEAARFHEHMARMCEIHGADEDRAEALISLGQCLLGLSRGDEAKDALQQALQLAVEGGQTHMLASASLTTISMGTGDLDGALEVAKAAASVAARSDNYRAYIRIVGVITHIQCFREDHKAAYRSLVDIYGILLAKFGPEAAAPIRTMIGVIREAVGDERFEALSRELLAERQTLQA